MSKKIILTIFGIIAFAFICSTSYAAPDRIGQFDVGFHVAGHLPDSSDFQNTAYVGSNLSYGVNEWFAIGLSAGWTQSDAEENISGVNIEGGDLTAVPIMADFIFRMPNVHKEIVPYAVVGVGGVFYDVDDIVVNTGPGTLRVESEVDNSFAVKVGGGFDWFLSDWWIFNFEFSYTFADSEVEVTSNNLNFVSDADLDYWLIGAGLKYLFD